MIQKSLRTKAPPLPTNEATLTSPTAGACFHAGWPSDVLRSWGANPIKIVMSWRKCCTHPRGNWACPWPLDATSKEPGVKMANTPKTCYGFLWGISNVTAQSGKAWSWTPKVCSLNLRYAFTNSDMCSLMFPDSGLCSRKTEVIFEIQCEVIFGVHRKKCSLPDMFSKTIGSSCEKVRGGTCGALNKTLLAKLRVILGMVASQHYHLPAMWAGWFSRVDFKHSRSTWSISRACLTCLTTV